MLAVEWFFGLATPGQWVVIVLVGMLVTGVLGFLDGLSKGESNPGLAFVIGPLCFLVLFMVVTILLCFVSLLQFLWGI